MSMYVRDFDLSNSLKSEKVLSVLLHDDSIYYAIMDQSHKMYAHQTFREVSFDSDIETILSDKCLQADYQHVAICVMGNKYFHLPEVNNDIKDLVLSMRHKTLYTDRLAGNEAITHFGLTDAQQSILTKIIRGSKSTIHHFSNVLSLYYLHQNGPVIHAHIEENELHIYVAIESEYGGYRQVDVKSVDDILYFILAFYKEFGLDPSEDLLTISGWLDADSALFTKIYGFIAKVYWVEDSSFGLVANKPENLKDHYYFAHFANSLCVSSVEN
jgi:hypothetical protein